MEKIIENHQKLGKNSSNGGKKCKKLVKESGKNIKNGLKLTSSLKISHRKLSKFEKEIDKSE